MRFYQLAIKYLYRKKGKSILLGTILFVALFLCLSGIAMLRISENKLAALAEHSEVNVGLFTDGVHNKISDSKIQMIQQLDNITFINKGNHLKVTVEDSLYIGMKEPVFGVGFTMHGLDDHTLDGPFYMESIRLVKGTLKLEKNQIIVAESLAKENHWDIGTTLPVKSEHGVVKNSVVAGIYRLPWANIREGVTEFYTTTSFIDELQGKHAYASVAFYVKNPNLTERTEQEIKELVKGAEYTVSVSDAIYQKLKAPLDHIKNIVRLILIVTLIISAVIVILLLSLAIRERRKETALLLSIGKSKAFIITQRLVEVFLIMAMIFILIIPLNSLVIPKMGNLIFSSTSSVAEKSTLVMSVYDVLKTVGIGSAIVFLMIMLSSISLIRTKPKQVLSAIE